MMSPLICIKDPDVITTRERCATCDIDCENVEKAAKEDAKMKSVLSKYTIDEIRSENPPEEIIKLMNEIRANE